MYSTCVVCLSVCLCVVWRQMTTSVWSTTAAVTYTPRVSIHPERFAVSAMKALKATASSASVIKQSVVQSWTVSSDVMQCSIV